MLLQCLSLMAVVVGAQTILTMPMGVHLKTLGETQLSHLRHFRSSNETYALHSRLTLFTLNLTVNDLPYQLSIDTGSSDFFIKGENMTGDPEQKYSCEQCVRLNDHIKIGYLDGHLHTYRTKATIRLGEHSFKQHILVAYKASTKNYEDMGGIIGLSFQEMAKNNYPNFINTLIDNRIIDSYVFGVKLNFRRKGESFITFGGSDSKYIKEDAQINYYPIPEGTLKYKLKIHDITVGGVQLPVHEALLDTGNTCISIPAQHAESILEEFNRKSNKCRFDAEPGNKRFDIMNCMVSNFDELPTITTHIGEHSYSVGPEYYLDECQRVQEGEYNCSTMLEAVRGRTYALLGDLLFLKYYAVFDLEKRRIGLARNNDHTTLDDVLHHRR